MFVVQRYTGDRPSTTTEQKEAILKRLQSKVQERKNKNVVVPIEKVEEDHISEEGRKKKRSKSEREKKVKKGEDSDEKDERPKKKKRKSTTETAEDESVLGDDAVNSVGEQKKKKSKKEKKQDEDESREEEMTEIEVPEEIEEIEEETQPIAKAKNHKTGPVLPEEPKVKVMPQWMEHAVLIDTNLDDDSVPVDSLDLDPALVAALNREKVTYFFPVQRQVIPLMMRAGRLPGVHPGDVCVSAPTGSGKTLAYVIPVVQCLLDRVVPRLRALVLLPTRDLALQVKNVFDAYVRKTDLRVVIATGHTSFEKEQKLLVEKGEDGSMHSIADIVVATPGRLVDHIASTEGFTLAHLRYLVIDEADRLLGQAYQDWLPKVLASAHPTAESTLIPGEHLTTRAQLVSLTPARNAQPQLPLQKLVFSATLSHNPEKLSALQLHRPHLVAASTGARYIIPSRLKESMVVCTAGEKPMVLLHFLKALGKRRVLCFTASVDASHRLFLLLKLYGGLEVAEYSSHLSQDQRHHMLEAFRADRTQVLVCSDAMARGMDVDDVETVICYDAPAYIKTYVHRVGRTARAGRSGEAYTLLKSNEVRHFKLMHKKAETANKLVQLTIKADLLDQYEARLT
eukprot:Ihof_evm11s49 gene=Ihof_evmTU11s49